MKTPQESTKGSMVLRYQAFSSLSVVPYFALPFTQIIAEMLWRNEYISTPDLKAGFHQICVTKGDWQKAAFCIVLGLLE